MRILVNSQFISIKKQGISEMFTIPMFGRFAYLKPNIQENIMNHRFRNVVIALLLVAGIVAPVWLWMRTPSPENHSQ